MINDLTKKIEYSIFNDFKHLDKEVNIAEKDLNRNGFGLKSADKIKAFFRDSHLIRGACVINFLQNISEDLLNDIPFVLREKNGLLYLFRNEKIKRKNDIEINKENFKETSHYIETFIRKNWITIPLNFPIIENNKDIILETLFSKEFNKYLKLNPLEQLFKLSHMNFENDLGDYQSEFSIRLWNMIVFKNIIETIEGINNYEVEIEPYLKYLNPINKLDIFNKQNIEGTAYFNFLNNFYLLLNKNNVENFIDASEKIVNGIFFNKEIKDTTIVKILKEKMNNQTPEERIVLGSKIKKLMFVICFGQKLKGMSKSSYLVDTLITKSALYNNEVSKDDFFEEKNEVVYKKTFEIGVTQANIIFNTAMNSEISFETKSLKLKILENKVEIIIETDKPIKIDKNILLEKLIDTIKEINKRRKEDVYDMIKKNREMIVNKFIREIYLLGEMNDVEKDSKRVSKKI